MHPPATAHCAARGDPSGDLSARQGGFRACTEVRRRCRGVQRRPEPDSRADARMSRDRTSVVSGTQRLRIRVSPLENIVKQAASRALDGDDVTGLLAVLQIDPLTTARYLRVANS